MADQAQLAALMQALGGGNSRFYSPGTTAAGPVVAPQQSARVSDQFLARSLGGPAPNSLGQGIYSAAQSLGAGLAARGQKQQALEDQQKQTDAYNRLVEAMTAGQTVPGGAAEAAGVAAVPGGMSNAQTSEPGLYGADSPTLRLAQALAASGNPMMAMQLIGSDVEAQRAAAAKAAAEAAAFKRDLYRDEYKSDLTRRPDSPETHAQKLARAAATAGYQAPGTGRSLEPIPGGAADPNAQAEAQKKLKTAELEAKFESAFPKVREQVQGMNRDFSNLMPVIDRAISNSNAWTSGLLGERLSKIAGTPAADLRNDLETIRANRGFGRLQEMRNNSPTGGALGNVSDSENRLLQAVDRALQNDQSPAQLRSNLMDVKRLMVATQQDRTEAFRSDYGKFLPQDWQPSISPNAEQGKQTYGEGTVITSPDPSKPDLIMRGGKWVPYQ